MAVLFQKECEPFTDDMFDDGPYFLRAESAFRLTFELEQRLRYTNANDRRQSFTDILPIQIFIILSDEVIFLGVFIYRLRGGGPRSEFMRPAVFRPDVVD